MGKSNPRPILGRDGALDRIDGQLLQEHWAAARKEPNVADVRRYPARLEDV